MAASTASRRSRRRRSCARPTIRSRSRDRWAFTFSTLTFYPRPAQGRRRPAVRHDFGTTSCPRWSMTTRCSPSISSTRIKEALYWRDVGTLEAFYEANMDIVSVSPIFNLYDKSWPIRTHQRQYPPAKFVFAETGRTGTAARFDRIQGCIVSGGTSTNSRPLARRACEFLRGSGRQHLFRTSVSDAAAASARRSSTATSTSQRAPPSAMTRRPTARNTSSPKAASPSSPATTRSLRARSPWTTTPATKLLLWISKGPEASFRVFAFASSPVRCLQFRTTGDSVHPAW